MADGGNRDDAPVIAWTTAGDLTEAHRLADALVGARLAACVQLSPISSVYRWNDRVETEPEVRLVIKTRRALLPAIEALFAEIHSYDTPQLVATPITDGAAAYLDWLAAETAPETEVS